MLPYPSRPSGQADSDSGSSFAAAVFAARCGAERARYYPQQQAVSPLE
jgi:hypothetical protein